MKLIAWFYTIFWIIYFPTCIAFNTLPGLSSVDEAMTFVLIGFTALCYKNKSINKEPILEYMIFLAILAFYIVYSIFWGENVIGGIFLEFLQQIRPFSIIYCTWILNPRFSKLQKNWISLFVILTLIARVLIRNEGEGGQEDLSAGQIAICAGMVWLTLHNNTKLNRNIALGLVLFGLFAATKSKFYAEVICFIAIITFIKKKINIFSAKSYFMTCILGAIVLFVVWEKFEIYYISGMNDDAGIARAESLKVGFGKILWDYIPFGPGMGTFATNGAWKYYSPLYEKYDLTSVWGLQGGFICDVFYPSLCQYGLVGLFLFGWFWQRRLKAFNAIYELKYFRIALMAFLCLALEQMADSSWLSGKGMGYCMLIGLCLNANKNVGVTDDGKPIEEEAGTEKKEEIVYPKLLTATP